MRHVLKIFTDFFRKGDLILLSLCLLTSAFGCVEIASATNYNGYTRFLIVQIAAIMIGVTLYMLITAVDADFLSEHRRTLLLLTMLFLLLLIPFGTDNGSGNRSWLDIPLVPVNIQPAEICKISFILIMASVMASHQSRISSVPSIIHMCIPLLLIVGLNMVLSGDAGVSLIFVFIFAGMAFAGGVSLFWFLLGGGCIALGAPILWHFMGDYQKLRIQILFDPTIDPQGFGPRWHSKQSLLTLNGGGLAGQGLFNGSRVQTDTLAAQHTDYIFSSIGEEMGFIGCMIAIILLLAIIIRCIYVGFHAKDYMRRVICFGAASALIFQVCSNIGMCLGITPVIGLTLPFISYGGSSIVSLYAMLGLVSGVHARPQPDAHERYIRPLRT